MSTDPWVGAATRERSQSPLSVRKYRVTAVDDFDQQVATLEASDGTTFDVRFPGSVAPSVNRWAWCIQGNGAVWPFAVD